MGTRVRKRDRSVTLSEESAAYVHVEPAGAAKLQASRVLVARVTYDERHVSRIGAPVQGRVSKIDVVTGDRVGVGAVLLTLTAPEIASAQAQVAQAKTARVLAERAASRASMLVVEGAGTEAERLQAEAALAQATSEEKRATAALAAIGGASGPTGYQLRSPIAGTVVERNVSVGSQVHTEDNQPLLTIADLSNVWVVADVYEQDLAGIRVGDEAVVAVLAYPNRKFEARIAQVGNVVRADTNAAQARIELANRDGLLRPGMFANVQVRGASTGAAEVPTSAVLARRDQFYVFVKDAEGAYVQREVKLGDHHGEHSTILEGVTPGELVVTEGAILLDAEVHEAL